MNSIVLSERLFTIASFVPKGSNMADIGSDHALLPCFLVSMQVVPFAIAGELNEGPFKSAESQVEQYGLKERISVRKGNGLEVIQEPDRIDVITIAGMGGALIANILEKGREKLLATKRLILQPNVGEEQVRWWLDRHGWQIIDETILEENEKIYEIIVAESKLTQLTDPYNDHDMSREELYRLGPILWRKKGPILLKKWMKEQAKIDYIRSQLAYALSEVEKSKTEQRLSKESQWITGVLECLQKDKPSFKSSNS
ncbi:tRNA (adenine(22)-N(1))-methyltransferase TrmK [Tepidibacillus marianensis]|uniref:tRNA (adenine(22)-N(1))-methyltransferase n=1 Tax=Tepidibacillus marianensis TaxID=3131995 RepID=UPI0030D32E22